MRRRAVLAGVSFFGRNDGARLARPPSLAAGFGLAEGIFAGFALAPGRFFERSLSLGHGSPPFMTVNVFRGLVARAGYPAHPGANAAGVGLIAGLDRLPRLCSR